ncbi:MAG: OsmC family protein [Eubacteriales bacterium]
MSDLQFHVKVKSDNATKSIAQTRGFAMIIDEPGELGGTNAGANPVEYVLAALGGCLNVVGHLVAKEMELTFNGMEIDLEGDLNPGKFSGKSQVERAGYKEIRVRIKPDTDADENQLQSWLREVENRCPVSDTITNATTVLIALGQD